MPHLETWNKLPPAIRQHLMDRMRDRRISIADLNKLRIWVESKPLVLEGNRSAFSNLPCPSQMMLRLRLAFCPTGLPPTVHYLPMDNRLVRVWFRAEGRISQSRASQFLQPI
jgi:hypothetical protein